MNKNPKRYVNIPLDHKDVITFGIVVNGFIEPSFVDILARRAKDVEPIPPIHVRYLIDTGSSTSYLSPEIIDKLNPPHRGSKLVHGIGGKKEINLFSCAVKIVIGESYIIQESNIGELDELYKMRSYADGILGMDFLDSFSFGYDPKKSLLRLKYCGFRG